VVLFMYASIPPPGEAERWSATSPMICGSHLRRSTQGNQRPRDR
jgi:hypothetical protein